MRIESATDLSLAVRFVFGLPLVGQSDIGGTVTDSTSTPLPGANVVFLRASDSFLVAFATTHNKVDFLLENVPVRTPQMHGSFPGFDVSPPIIAVSDT